MSLGSLTTRAATPINQLILRESSVSPDLVDDRAAHPFYHLHLYVVTSCHLKTRSFAQA